MSDRPPYENNDYGLDFRVHIENNIEKQEVILWDNFGFFLPCPTKLWHERVNLGYWQKLIKELPYVHPNDLYWNAVSAYCKDYNFCYIGLN